VKIRVLILADQNGFKAEAYTSDESVRRRVLEIVRFDLPTPGHVWEGERGEMEELLHEGADLVELRQAVDHFAELKRREGFGDSSESLGLVETELKE